MAATVNGDKIMESEIDAVFNAWKENNPHAQGMGAEQLDQMRKHFGPQILQMLVNAKLLDAEVAKAGLKITDEDLGKKLEGDVQRHLLMRGMSREELDEQVHSQTGRCLKEVLDTQLADPHFRQSVLQNMLIEQKFPDKVQVTDQEVEADYERDFEMMYQRPAQVRASHILVDTQKAKTDEEKAAAKKKIEEILVEVKQPGADFAALAKAHSDCPSSAKGGDLGFFPREGMMAEPFAAAAFGLEVGQISDVVETPFGYHIIKVMAKKPAMVTTLDQAREAIRQQIKERKAAELVEQFVSDLEKAAKIEYAEQSGLEPPSASQPVAPEQASNKPAESTTSPPAAATEPPPAAPSAAPSAAPTTQPADDTKQS